MGTNSIEAIDAGFPATDRYSQAECERNPMALAIAEGFEKRVAGKKHWLAKVQPKWVSEHFKLIVEGLYKEIPVRVIPVIRDPYENAEQMFRDIRDHKRMYNRAREGRGAAVVSNCMEHWRAVHDYYGHYLRDAPFTWSGELLAYQAHTAQFARFPEALPFVKNNVVDENTRRLVRGTFLCVQFQCSSPIVYDDEHFGPAELWFRPRF